jgi:RNA polymerase sigma-70 factor, ECF subfamily
MSAMLEPHSPIVADAVLMNRLAQRDSTALVELERRHRGSLYAQAYGILMDAGSAERVVRDTFAQLWFAAANYAGKRSPWTLLREMARELARAERALHDSPTRRR